MLRRRIGSCALHRHCLRLVARGLRGAGERSIRIRMTRDEVARVAEAPLIYLSGPRGSERYLIERRATVPGFYPVDTRIVLQFRRDRLTGWRRDWQMRPYWF